MNLLGMTSQDIFIISTMFAACGLAIRGAIIAKLILVKIGVLIAAVMICIGMSCFGWKPLFGGGHVLQTYFGSIMLFLGLQSAVILTAIEEVYRRFAPADSPARGFPVIPKRES